MKKTLIILLLIPLFLFSQNFVKTWQQCYGGSNDDRVRSIIPYKNGYLFLGHTRSTDGDISYNPSVGSAWLVNIDNKGNIIFDKCYEGYDWAYGDKILPINTGGYYLLGESGHNTGLNGYWLAKIDTSFNLIWQDVLGGSYVENFRGGCIAYDGGIIESGITGSPDGDIEEYYGTFDNWLVKLNADGSRDWVKTYGNVGAEEGGNIIPTSDGGYIYACSGYNELPGNTYCDGHDGQMAEAWLIKLDANGEKEWHRCYGGSYIDLIQDVIELEDGYIAVGSSDSGNGDLPGHYGIAGENLDIWVIRTGVDGSIIWSQNYGGYARDASRNIFKNFDGTFTVFGSTESHYGDVQGNNAPNNQTVVWMIKIDENGNILYQKPFDHEPYLGGSNYLRISDYKYIIASTKRDGCNYTWNNHNDDIYIYEIQDMDEFIPGQAMGVDRVCLGVETETYYFTTLVVDTMETQWLLEPEEAGIITAMHDSVLINWNMEFNDTAWLQVKSMNIYGESSYSPAKEIIVYQPINVSEIIGPDTICTVVNEQTTFSTSNPESLNLSWQINPTEAGTIITQEDTAIIIWDSFYEGAVELKTSTINNCEDTIYSPTKVVQIKTCLGTNEPNHSSLKVYPNPANEYMIFVLPENEKQNQLTITDIYGRIIKSIPIKEHQKQIKWNCKNIKSSVYFYKTEIHEKIYKGQILVE